MIIVAIVYDIIIIIVGAAVVDFVVFVVVDGEFTKLWYNLILG